MNTTGFGSLPARLMKERQLSKRCFPFLTFEQGVSIPSRCACIIHFRLLAEFGWNVRERKFVFLRSHCSSTIVANWLLSNASCQPLETIAFFEVYVHPRSLIRGSMYSSKTSTGMFSKTDLAFSRFIIIYRKPRRVGPNVSSSADRSRAKRGFGSAGTRC